MNKFHSQFPWQTELLAKSTSDLSPAEAIVSTWINGELPIPAAIKRERGVRESSGDEELFELKRNRDSVLRGSLILAFQSLNMHSAEQLQYLIITIASERLAVPPGVVTEFSEHSVSHRTICTTIEYWRAHMHWPAPREKREKSEMIDYWNRAMAITLLAKLQKDHMGCVDSIIASLGKNEVLPNFKAPGQKGCYTCLPTEDSFKLDLIAHQWLSQLLYGDRAKPFEDNPLYWKTSITPKRQNSYGQGDSEYRTGLKNIHLHFAVLLERLTALPINALTDFPTRPQTIMNLPSNLPQELAVNLLPAHREGAALCLRPAAKKAGFTTRFAPPVSQTERARLLDPITLQVDSPSAFTADEDCMPSLASIQLNLSDLAPRSIFLWLDVVLLVEQNDHWHIIDIEAIDHDESGRVDLCPNIVLPLSLSATDINQRIVSAKWAIRFDEPGAYLTIVIKDEQNYGGS